MSEQSYQHLNALAEEVGNFIQYWGFKKVHGKVWTHLFLSEEPLDAADLMERLGISKSLVSITISDLLKYDVIRKVGKSSKDTLVYSSNPKIRDVILNVIRGREQKMLGRVRQEFDIFSRNGTTGVNLDRIGSLDSMIKEAQEVVEAIVSLKACDFGRIQMS